MILNRNYHHFWVQEDETFLWSYFIELGHMYGILFFKNLAPIAAKKNCDKLSVKMLSHAPASCYAAPRPRVAAALGFGFAVVAEVASAASKIRIFFKATTASSTGFAN